MPAAPTGQDGVNLVPGLADEVRWAIVERLVSLLTAGYDILGEGMGAAAGAVGDGDEVRVEGGESA